MMVALNRGEELRMHVCGAFNNGVTRDEIKEVLLQSAVYCGVPAANSAFHIAGQVFDEMHKKTKAKSRATIVGRNFSLMADGCQWTSARRGRIRS